jgi:hypothetical protein
MTPRAFKNPLIPAKAGTQIEKRRAGISKRRPAPYRTLARHMIWVPACAGMSGLEMQSLGKA